MQEYAIDKNLRLMPLLQISQIFSTQLRNYNGGNDTINEINIANHSIFLLCTQWTKSKCTFM